MPYDELGNFYGDSDIPNSPPTTDLDAMKLALENQQVRQKSLQNRSTPESYNRTQQALSLLPGQVMPNGQSPIPVKPPISTATNIPQALLDVSGASALPQTLLSMGTGYAEALAKGMGLDDVADKLHYEPTSKYANDINEALGNLASKTGPLPELMSMGKNRTVTPSDVQVLGARAIETGRQLKRLPEDFQLGRQGFARMGVDNEPTIGARLGTLENKFIGEPQRQKLRQAASNAPQDVAYTPLRERVAENYEPGMPMYAVRKTNEGFVPRQEVPETGGDIVQIRNQIPMSELDRHIIRSLEDMPMVMLSNDEPNEQAMTDYLQRFVFKDISSYKGDNPDVKHNHDLNNAYDNFKNKKLEELFSNVGNIDRYDRNKLFSSVYNDAQRKALEHQWFDEFTKAELKDLTFNTRDEIKDNVPVKDANGKIVKDENGNNVTKEVTLYKPKDLKFPSFEEHKKRMEAAKIIMNEVYPNYIQKFLGTPDDPLLMKAKEGITMKESSTFPNVETDPTAHMSLTEERRRREAGFPERGQFYDEYLNQLDEHEKVQNAYQNALAELEQTPPFIDNARNPQWSAKKKVFDKLQKPLDDSQKKLDNLRLAMSYERQADLALKEKTTAKNYLDEKSAINRAVFPSILKANPDTPIYDINQDNINFTGSRLLVRSLVNDVLSGEKSILDKNGQPDPNIVRSTNIASYIDDVVKPRLIEEAKNKRDTEKIANDYKQENVQIMKRALSRMPKAGNYGTIVPNLVNNRVYTPDEIRQILSNITWELDHCIGQDGRDQVNRMHNTGDKRNYLPKLKPLTLEPFNKKTGNNDNQHIRGTIDGLKNKLIFVIQLRERQSLQCNWRARVI